MAVTIERRLGREMLIDAFCDPRKLLRTYNEAAAPTDPTRSATWSATLTSQIGSL
jgi:hypothetical protein